MSVEALSRQDVTLRKISRSTPLVLAAALIILLAACEMGGSTAAPPANGSLSGVADESAPANGETTVTIDSLAFGQDAVTVPAGTTIVWDNKDGVGHTVTHGEDGQAAEDAAFDMAVAPGQTVSFTFDARGEYSITCTIHPQMNMTVVVE